MSNHQQVRNAVNRWKKELLQLDRRNNRIHFKFSKTTIELLNFPPRDVDHWIRGGAKPKKFAYKETPESSVQRGQLKTNFDEDPGELQKRLRALYRKNKEWEEEQGISALHLAVGFLNWVDEGGETAKAPLILLPCRLTRESARSPYALQGGEDPEINETLQHMLKHDYGIELPEFYDDMTIEAYLEEAERAVRERNGWSIEDRCSPSVFSSSKRAMYEDLDRMSEEDEIHPLVRELAAASESPDESPDPSPPHLSGFDGGKLDDLLPIKDQLAVMDADASQLLTIKAALDGKHLVVHGPPGTGKSQTIVNLIATYLGKGRRVLFVSEKKAALDVVKKRMDKRGLGVFCLDLHSERAKKSEVYQQLSESLEDDQTPHTAGDYSHSDLERERGRLNQYVRDIHEQRDPFGISLYEAYGRFEKARHAPVAGIRINKIESMDKARLNRIEKAAESIARRSDCYQKHDSNRWSFLKEEIQPSVNLTDDLQMKLPPMVKAADGALKDTQAAATWAGVPAPATAEGCGRLGRLLDLLSERRAVPQSWLSREKIKKLHRTALKIKNRQAARRELESAVQPFFGGRFPNLDYPSIAQKLQETKDGSDALDAVFQDEWKTSAVQNPERLIRQLDKAIEALRDVQDASQKLGRALDIRINSPQELLDAQTAADQLLPLYPAPASWLDPLADDSTRRKLKAWKTEIDRLIEEQKQLLERWDERLVDAVSQEMLERYRRGIQSVFRYLKGSWYEDQRLLSSMERSASKQPPHERCKAIEYAVHHKKGREDWLDPDAPNSETLKQRFPNYNPLDFEHAAEAVNAFTEDFEKTAELRDEIRSGIRQFNSLLTNQKSHDSLKDAADEARRAVPRLKEVFEAAGGFDPTNSVDSFNAIASQAEEARGALEALRSATADWKDSLASPPADFSALLTLIDNAVEIREIEQEDEKDDGRLANDFADRYQGPDTDWGAVLSALEWTDQALQCAPVILNSSLKKHFTDPADSSEYEERADAVQWAELSVSDAASALNELFDIRKTPWDKWERASFTELRSWAEELLSDAAAAVDYLGYRKAVRALDAEIGGGAVGCVRKTTDDASLVPDIVRRRLYGEWIDRIRRATPSLHSFSSADHEAVIDAFKELDRKQKDAAVSAVRQRCFGNYATTISSIEMSSQSQTLNRERTKKRRQMPVRDLFQKIPDLVGVLKPCVLLSPLAVSQYLPRSPGSGDANYDAVIFDEASQIFPEDAVPAIARAKQTIVVGDKEQLPPTSFFRRSRGDDDDDTYEEEEEYEDDALKDQGSILEVMIGMAGLSVKECRLETHYRSRHEDLIRFSNHFYYDDRLLTFPAPRIDHHEENHLGVRSVYRPHGRYDAGGTRANRVEAEAAVDEAFKILEARPKESVGVIALSRSQMELIERLMDARRVERRDLDPYFDESRPERFFVKNLENVQGDERDHIILSVGYGPTTGSNKIPNRFGPINAKGGERRLNVAVTRARRQMIVIHSLKPGDIRAEDVTHDGPRHLKRYLKYIREPASAIEGETSVNPNAEPESLFEEQVMHALRRKGHRVHPQVGVSKYRIDLAVLSEGGGSYDLGIECDGAAYHSSPAARDRDRQRQEVLEGLGWTIARVWSTSWSLNPEGEIERIEAALREARGQHEPMRAAASP